MIVNRYNDYENRSYPMMIVPSEIESIREIDSRYVGCLIRTKSGETIKVSEDYTTVTRRYNDSMLAAQVQNANN